MKRTQREKDYAVIGELASRLPPDKEVLLTTDPDRLLALAPSHGREVTRPAVQAALTGDRDAVVVALARERNRQQLADRARLDAYAGAARRFADEFAALASEKRVLPGGHAEVCSLAERWLPTRVDCPEDRDADAE